MASSFFSGLNPASTESGIEGIKDRTVFGSIDTEFNKKNADFIKQLKATFWILYGDHDAENDQNTYSFFNPEELPFEGSKGVLDFLIFPLVFRKLRHCVDDMLSARKTVSDLELKVFPVLQMVLFGLERATFIPAIILTIALSPIVALKYLLVDLELSKISDGLSRTY